RSFWSTWQNSVVPAASLDAAASFGQGAPAISAPGRGAVTVPEPVVAVPVAPVPVAGVLETGTPAVSLVVTVAEGGVILVVVSGGWSVATPVVTATSIGGVPGVLGGSQVTTVLDDGEIAGVLRVDAGEEAADCVGIAAGCNRSARSSCPACSTTPTSTPTVIDRTAPPTAQPATLFMAYPPPDYRSRLSGVPSARAPSASAA